MYQGKCLYSSFSSCLRVPLFSSSGCWVKTKLRAWVMSVGGETTDRRTADLIGRDGAIGIASRGSGTSGQEVYRRAFLKFVSNVTLSSYPKETTTELSYFTSRLLS